MELILVVLVFLFTPLFGLDIRLVAGGLALLCGLLCVRRLMRAKGQHSLRAIIGVLMCLAVWQYPTQVATGLTILHDWWAAVRSS